MVMSKVRFQNQIRDLIGGGFWISNQLGHSFLALHWCNLSLMYAGISIRKIDKKRHRIFNHVSILTYIHPQLNTLHNNTNLVRRRAFQISPKNFLRKNFTFIIVKKSLEYNVQTEYGWQSSILMHLYMFTLEVSPTGAVLNKHST